MSEAVEECTICRSGRKLCPKSVEAAPTEYGLCVYDCDAECMFDPTHWSYEDKNECQICHSTCFHCNGPTANDCTSCIPQLKLQPQRIVNVSYTGYCTSSPCIDGTFPNNTKIGLICNGI